MAINPTSSERALATETIEALRAHCPTLLKEKKNGVLNITIEEEAISFARKKQELKMKCFFIIQRFKRINSKA